MTSSDGLAWMGTSVERGKASFSSNRAPAYETASAAPSAQQRQHSALRKKLTNEAAAGRALAPCARSSRSYAPMPRASSRLAMLAQAISRTSPAIHLQQLQVRPVCRLH